MRLATWNVNSLNARQARVEEWLTSVRPDVVCLQETKLADDAFGSLAFGALGYDAAHAGQGRWNGVAILSRVGLDDVHVGFADGIEPDDEARLLSATCGGVRVSSVYVPNGRAVDDDHYRYKLDWLDRLIQHVRVGLADGLPMTVMGDWNIAPTDLDVWNPARMEGGTHVTEPERSALARLAEVGLVDVFRRLHPEGGLFSWWDYRGGSFHKREGLRIDYALCTEDLASVTRRALVDRNARKGQQPSDHAPVLYDVATEELA